LEQAANLGPEADEPPDQALLDELPEQFKEAASEGLVQRVEPPEAGEEQTLEEDLEVAAQESEAEAETPAQRGAQTRIRNLVKERNDLRQQAAAREAEMQRQVYAMQQQQAQLAQQQQAALQEQNAKLEKQLELLTSRKEIEEEQNLSPMDQYERKILRQAKQQAAVEAEQKVAALQQQVQAQEQQRQKAIAEQQRRQRYVYYSNQAAQARNEALLNQMEQNTAQALAQETDEMLLAYSAAYGLEPKDAAPRFRRYLDKYAQAAIKRQSAAAGARVRQSRQVPASAPTGRVATQQTNAWPSLQDLRAAGFDSHPDWIAAGEPAVKSTK
jgi:hypothetical protein